MLVDLSFLRRWREKYYQPVQLEEVDLDGDEMKFSDGHLAGRRLRRSFPLVAVCIGIAALVVVAALSTSSDLVSTISTHFKPCPAQCPTDPFLKPGILHFGAYPNETRWLPLPDASEVILDRPPWPVIDYNNDAIADDALMEACPQYMKMMDEDDPEMAWVADKTVVIIGTSHDRLNIVNFCSYAGGRYTTNAGGDHGGGWCYIARYNFTLANWFHFGMVDGEYDWFHSPKNRPVTYESRIHDNMLPMMEQAGVPGVPDLILYGSVFWDERFLEERAREQGAELHVSLTYTELSWHRARVQSLVTYLRNLYGNRVPIMFRGRHFRFDNRGNGILRIFQLDQSMRAAAKDLGVKIFEWGSKLEGQTNMFADGVHHFEKGRATFLFGDMMLFYLKRATTPRCWQCHQWRD